MQSLFYELEGQLGYEDLPQMVIQSNSFKEGIEYIILRDSNLLKFKELLNWFNSIEPVQKAGLELLKRTSSLLLLTESGLYTAMILSRKPQSETFRRWITCEVLPSIRKKVFYLHSPQGDTELSTTGETQANLEQKNTLFYKMISRLVDNQAKLQKQIQQFSPKFPCI